MAKTNWCWFNVDSLTHIVIGASIGILFANHNSKKLFALIGAIACTAPDFDVLFYSTHDPLFHLMIHRGFTHSFIFIPIGSLMIAGCVLILSAQARMHVASVIKICFLAYASHGILDACTSYGTCLLWPFSDLRVSWDTISIIDPIFTAILVAGLVTSYRRVSTLPGFASILLALAYIGFGFYQHARALNVLQEDLRKQSLTAEALRVTPKLASLTNWNSLYIANRQVMLGSLTTPLVGPNRFSSELTYPLLEAEQLPRELRSHPEAIAQLHRFVWFSQGWVTMIPDKDSNSLNFLDLRYIKKLPKPPLSYWGLVISHQNDQYIYSIKYKLLA